MRLAVLVRTPAIEEDEGGGVVVVAKEGEEAVAGHQVAVGGGRHAGRLVAAAVAAVTRGRARFVRACAAEARLGMMLVGGGMVGWG